jgi:hypothetical protein
VLGRLDGVDEDDCLVQLGGECRNAVCGKNVREDGLIVGWRSDVLDQHRDVGVVVPSIEEKCGVDFEPEIVLDILKSLGSESCRDGEEGDVGGEESTKARELAVLLSEVTSPLQDAVSFVDDNHGKLV